MKNKLLYIFTIALIVNISLFGGINDDIITPKEAIKLIGKKNVVFVSGDAIAPITGSVSMDAHHLHHSDITGNMHCAPLFMCPDEAKEYIEKHGISNDTLIIAYDNYKGPNSTGVYGYFKTWGHKNIKILNGGSEGIKAIDPMQDVYEKKYKELNKAKKLVKLGKLDKSKLVPIESELKSIKSKLKVNSGVKVAHKKGHYEIDTNKIDRSWIAGKEEVYHAMKDILKKGDKSKYVIIDARRMIEIIGENKIDNVARGGHIPGATFIEWVQIADEKNKDGFKSLNEMRKVFKKYGVTKDKTIYAYCHVGAGRSSHEVVALKMLGYKNVKIYTGSWDEWGNDLDLPISR